MCGCDWNFVCGRCRGFTRFDWRLEHEPEPETPDETLRRLDDQERVSRDARGAWENR